jgi:ketosteroid isomerase-like protein
MVTEHEQAIVLRFNSCITARDIDALAALMTDDHRFIDSAGHVVIGKATVLRAWKGFFAAFPDYRNIFDRIDVTDGVVVMAGRSACADMRLDGPALWRARVRDGRVAEWQIYEDTPEHRRELRFEQGF